MRIPAATLVLLVQLLLPSAPRAAEEHYGIADFIESARTHIGEHVTVEDCHLVFATDADVTCLGLSQRDAAGDIRPIGRVVIRVAAAHRQSLLRALSLCEGGGLDDACQVSVSGIVYDASREFGIEDPRLVGLREGTINWAD